MGLGDLTNLGGPEWDQSFAGGGPTDSAAQMVKSLQNDEAFSVAANGMVLGLDALDLLTSPLETIATSAIGWLLEHISFLDMFLDFTTGDPTAIEAAIRAFNQAATDLDALAAEQIKALSSEVPTYADGDSESYRALAGRAMPRAEEIKTESLTCLGLAGGMTVAGQLAATCRGYIRDELADLVWRLLKMGAVALASAPYTGGGSLVALASDTAIHAARTAQSFARKLSDVATRLTELSGKLGKLAEALDHFPKNAGPAVAKAVDTALAAPELTRADQAAARHEAAHPERPGPWHASGTLDG